MRLEKSRVFSENGKEKLQHIDLCLDNINRHISEIEIIQSS